MLDMTVEDYTRAGTVVLVFVSCLKSKSGAVKAQGLPIAFADLRHFCTHEPLDFRS